MAKKFPRRRFTAVRSLCIAGSSGVRGDLRKGARMEKEPVASEPEESAETQPELAEDLELSEEQVDDIKGGEEV
jgi:hypothetical protein